MKKFGGLILRNSAANLVRGSATAAVALALPYFLTHRLDTSRFAAWSLMLQIAAYAGYLDFGLQTAMARFVAQATELEQWERRDRLVATALFFLTLAACLAAVVIGMIIWNIPTLFHGIPPGLMRELQWACCIVALSSCLLLPLSTYTGILVGLHRNEFPALAIGGSRLIGALAVVVGSRYTHSLVSLGSCIAIANLVGGLVQVAFVKRLLPNISFALSRGNKKLARELFHYCVGLTIYSVGMLLVGGLDVTIVGHFRFRQVGAYSIAGMLITFFAGLNTSVMSALITPIAAMQARHEIERIRGLVVQVTRLNVFVNCLFVIGVYLFGYPILELWVGRVYADQAIIILELLALAQAIRLIGGVYSAMLIATGQQNKGIQNGIAESLTNLFASVAGGALYGGIGVASGTLIGASIGTLWVLSFTMPSAKEIPFIARDFLSQAVYWPLLSAIPLCLIFFVPDGWLHAVVLIVATSMTLALAWKFNVIPKRSRTQVAT